MSATMLGLILIVVVLIALVVVLFLPRRGAQASSGASDQPSADANLRDDDQYWYGGVFYYNPDDPNAFVPKRFGLGWTINFGHPAGKFIALVMVAMIVLPIVLAIVDPGLRSSGCHPGACHLAP